MFGLKKIGKKKGQVWGTLIPWVIAIAVLILSFILYAIIYGKGEGALDFFKNLLRFGR